MTEQQSGGSEWLAHLSDTCMTITHLIGEEKKKRQCLRSTTHRQIITPRSFFSLAARARRLAVIGAKSGETESATEAFSLSLWMAFHKISPLPGGTPVVTTSAGASRAPVAARIPAARLACSLGLGAMLACERCEQVVTGHDGEPRLPHAAA